MLSRFDADWPSSTKVTARSVSLDGAYVATVTDWDAGGLGGGSNLEIRERKPSRFSVRLSRLFAGSYTDSFEQIEGIRWVGRRTLRVEYDGVPGETGHADSWGDVRFDYRPVPVN